jgi:hypothetical protein
MAEIKGEVRDKSGAGLVGVNVYYVNAAGNYVSGMPGAYTYDAGGLSDTWYIIEFIPNARLAFSMIGYEKQIIQLPNEPNDVNAWDIPFHLLDVVLEPETYSLNEVVITPGGPAANVARFPWWLVAIAAAIFVRKN